MKFAIFTILFSFLALAQEQPCRERMSYSETIDAAIFSKIEEGKISASLRRGARCYTETIAIGKWVPTGEVDAKGEPVEAFETVFTATVKKDDAFTFKFGDILGAALTDAQVARLGHDSREDARAFYLSIPPYADSTADTDVTYVQFAIIK